jgi:hypothetical protein
MQAAVSCWCVPATANNVSKENSRDHSPKSPSSTLQSVLQRFRRRSAIETLHVGNHSGASGYLYKPTVDDRDIPPIVHL